VNIIVCSTLFVGIKTQLGIAMMGAWVNRIITS